MTRHYRNYSEEDVKEAVKASKSFSAVCKMLGLVPKGGNIRTIKTIVATFDIDTSHFTGRGWNRGMYKKPETYKKASTIKKFLIRTFGHRCWLCKNTEWNNKPIPLELEHLDGNTHNNDVTNLQLLCCNCHAQTPTWRRCKSSLTGALDRT